MFCQACGAGIMEGARFCAGCGQPMGLAALQDQQRSRKFARHLQLLGCLWIAISVLNLLGAGALYVLSRANFLYINLPVLGSGLLPDLFQLLAWLVLLKSLAGFAAGFGLLERQPWARMLAMVLGCISLIKIPIGTALGIYTLWVLLPARNEAQYQKLATESL
jgi:predicted nucleic acid-binding Zn ribbon protein